MPPFWKRRFNLAGLLHGKEPRYTQSGHKPPANPPWFRPGAATTPARIIGEGKNLERLKKERAEARQALQDPNLTPEQRAEILNRHNRTRADMEGRKSEKGLIESILDFLFPKPPRYAYRH